MKENQIILNDLKEFLICSFPLSYTVSQSPSTVRIAIKGGFQSTDVITFRFYISEDKWVCRQDCYIVHLSDPKYREKVKSFILERKPSMFEDARKRNAWTRKVTG